MKTNRRDFIKGLMALGASALAVLNQQAQQPTEAPDAQDADLDLEMAQWKDIAEYGRAARAAQALDYTFPSLDQIIRTGYVDAITDLQPIAHWHHVGSQADHVEVREGWQDFDGPVVHDSSLYQLPPEGFMGSWPFDCGQEDEPVVVAYMDGGIVAIHRGSVEDAAAWLHEYLLECKEILSGPLEEPEIVWPYDISPYALGYQDEFNGLRRLCEREPYPQGWTAHDVEEYEAGYNASKRHAGAVHPGLQERMKDWPQWGIGDQADLEQPMTLQEQREWVEQFIRDYRRLREWRASQEQRA